MHIEDTQKG